MKVGELIEELNKYDDNMEVYDEGLIKIIGVEERTWVDSNYPYDKPDKQIVVIL